MRRWLSNAWKYAILGIGVGIFSGAAILTLGQWWVVRSSRHLIYQGIDEVPAREVALVPGVAAKNGRVTWLLRERLGIALALYRAHKVEAIVVSGVGAGPKEEIVVMRRWLQLRGVPPERIISDPAGYRTLDTMQRAANLLRVRGAIVCTQGLFMSRAVFLARGAGIDAVGVIAPQRTYLGPPSMRLEAVKMGLAVIDTYVLHRGPRVSNADGIVDGRTADRTLAAAAPSLSPQPRAAFSFFTSAISAGTAASQVATRP